MPSNKQKSRSCGTLYDPPSPGPWRISARLTAYKAFQSIFKDADEKTVREYVKRYAKRRGNCFAKGKKSKDWNKEITMLGDELAAKYWPDLREKSYLYYSLEQYVALIRQHANKYSTQKRMPSTNSKGNDPDDEAEDGDEEETAGSRSTTDSDKSADLSLTPTASTPDHSHNETIASSSIPATPIHNATNVTRPTGRSVDALVEELAKHVEGRLEGRINSLVQSEAGRIEGQIRDVRRDINRLMEDIRGLQDWAIAMGDGTHS